MDENRRKRFWDSLCLADDAAFSIALGGNTECASFIVRTILGRRDITVSSVHTQRSQRRMDSHCSIFDMLAYDDEGNLYDVEMQRSSASGDEIGARASYYEAMLGTRALRKGEKYSELRERIVIFILEEDAIGEDRDVYEYEFRDEEGKALEGSRVRIVLANTACHGRMRPDLESLYRDLYEPVVEKIRNPELREGLERVKGSADMSRRQNNIVNESNRQEIGVNALFQNEKLRAQVGFAAMPTKTYNSTTRYNSETGDYSPVTYDDFRWNFAPQVSLFADFSDYASMRMFYRGTSSQPSTSQLIPVPDNSDPMNISFGNPSLTPYFTHSLRGDYRYSNREKFTSFNLRFNGSYVQNPIVSTVWYGDNGGQFTMPFNGPSSFNVNLNSFANIPIGDSGFSVNNSLGGSYRKSASFVGENIDMSTYYAEDGGYYDFMNELIARISVIAFFF